MLNVTAGMHGYNTLLASAIYTCDLGFNMSGSAQRTCTNTSEWLPGAPTCTWSRNSLHLFMSIYVLFSYNYVVCTPYYIDKLLLVS